MSKQTLEGSVPTPSLPGVDEDQLSDYEPRVLSEAIQLHRPLAARMIKCMLINGAKKTIAQHPMIDYLKSHFMYGSLRRKFDTTALEGIFKDIVIRANAHRVNKVPLGDQVYVDLYQQAALAIEAFSSHWGVDKNLLLANNPALLQLKDWSEANPVKDQLRKALTYFAIAMVVAAAIGFLSGISALTYHGITFWVH